MIPVGCFWRFRNEQWQGPFLCLRIVEKKVGHVIGWIIVDTTFRACLIGPDVHPPPCRDGQWKFRRGRIKRTNRGLLRLSRLRLDRDQRRTTRNPMRFSGRKLTLGGSSISRVIPLLLFIEETMSSPDSIVNASPVNGMAASGSSAEALSVVPQDKGGRGGPRGFRVFPIWIVWPPGKDGNQRLKDSRCTRSRSVKTALEWSRHSNGAPQPT